MKKTIFALVGLLVLQVQAGVKLNGLFSDNMVLQRNQPVPVWGTADPGEEISVEFAGKSKTTKADISGHWKILLDPLESSSEPRSFQVSGFTSHVSLSNVLVGDVWLCAGQSNMAWTMKRFLFWDQLSANFSNDGIRLFKIKEGGVGCPEPTKELVIDPVFSNSWQRCSTDFAADFSATAGFFGMKLQEELGVPIGLLYANRGGTRANMWMPRKTLETKNIYAQYLDASNPEWKPTQRNKDAIRAPSNLYNGTIHPLAPFAIKGCIWYQGESDSQTSEIYAEMMEDLIQSWREEWGYDFPFLFVQLAPYDNVGWDGAFKEGWAWQREAQLETLAVPNTGMAVIIDAGEAKDIHPHAKKEPGERLAMIAASLDKEIDADFPILGKMNVDNGKALVQFSGVSGGLITQRVAMNVERGALPGQGVDAVVAEADELKGFTICGADRKFVEAKAMIISKDTVQVWSPDVKNPVAVRYGWANFPLCNLYGGNGMPASPGRTDDFPMPNLTGEKRGSVFTDVSPDWGKEMDLLDPGDGEYMDLGGLEGAVQASLYLYATADVNEPKHAVVRVVYFDEGFGEIQLRYDSTSAEVFAGKRPGVWKPAGEVKLKNSKTWNVVEFELPDGKFSKRCNGGDVRLQTTGKLIVRGIYISEK